MLSSQRERRARAQRGSVLSALLIIIAFLSILGGAMMSEISGQFLLGSTLSARIATQATVNSSVEYGIGQLQARSVPSRCSTDAPPGWPVNLNGMWAAATPNCEAIVPDLVAPLASGTFPADGTHVTIAGSDTYLVGNSGGHVYDYGFGQTAPLWTVALVAGVTGPPAQSVDSARSGHLITLVPDGSAVALIDDRVGSGAVLRCYMGTAGTVTSRPGLESPPTGSAAYFPEYAFIGDASGRLYVYDGQTNETCSQEASVSGLGGPVVGGPLVLPGTVTTSQGGGEGSETTTSDEVFAVVAGAGSSRLVHYSYQEQTEGSASPAPVLTLVGSLTLPFASAAGVAFNRTTPVDGQSIRLAITFAGGQVALVSINASGGGSGWTYTMSLGQSASLGGGFSHAPYWCHCPGGDRIGLGDQNGTLFVLDTGLNQVMRYPGGVAINTTPAADANGDWYFGADDGHVYDVEPPVSGTVMFKAATFGPGGQVRGSPVVASPTGCAGRLCMYFGSAGNGSFLAQIGGVRVMDLNACTTSGSGTTLCGAGKPRLWARIEVGDPRYVGGQGVNIIGWSYHNGP